MKFTTIEVFFYICIGGTPLYGGPLHFSYELRHNHPMSHATPIQWPVPHPSNEIRNTPPMIYATLSNQLGHTHPMSYATTIQWATPHPSNDLCHTPLMSYATPLQWSTPHPLMSYTTPIQWGLGYATPLQWASVRHTHPMSYATPLQWPRHTPQWALPHPSNELRHTHPMSYITPIQWGLRHTPPMSYASPFQLAMPHHSDELRSLILSLCPFIYTIKIHLYLLCSNSSGTGKNTLSIILILIWLACNTGKGLEKLQQINLSLYNGRIYWSQLPTIWVHRLIISLASRTDDHLIVHTEKLPWKNLKTDVRFLNIEKIPRIPFITDVDWAICELAKY
jgi:hypothetical protein